MTLEELKEYLKRNENEVDILELLNLTSDDIVERFEDVIEDKMDLLIEELELEDEELDE